MSTSTLKKQNKQTTSKEVEDEKSNLKQRKTTTKVENGDESTTTTTTTTETKTITKKPSTDKIKLNYPIFHCSSSNAIKEPYIVVGGGGGKSRTGVPNAITLFKWSDQENSSEFINVDQMETDDCIPFTTFNESKNQIAYFIGSHVYIVSYKNNRLEKFSDFDSNQNISANAFNSAISNLNNTVITTTTGNTIAQSSLNTGASGSPSPTPTLSSNKLIESNKDSEIRLMKFNKEGNRLIIVDTNNVVKIYSVPSYECVKLVITGHQGEITDLDINPASTHIATTSRDCSAKIINILNGKVEFTLQYKQKPKLAFRGCRFSHDGLYLYTAQSLPRTKQTTGCTVLSKWNFSNGQEEYSKEVDTFHNTTFSLSPDSKIIAISNADSNIIAFNSDTFKQLDKWEPHEFVITGACFSPDSSTIFSSSADYTCKSHRIGSYSNNNSKYFKLFIILAIIILIISVILGKLNN